jgi:hypothetical protein
LIVVTALSRITLFLDTLKSASHSLESVVCKFKPSRQRAILQTPVYTPNSTPPSHTAIRSSATQVPVDLGRSIADAIDGEEDPRTAPIPVSPSKMHTQWQQSRLAGQNSIVCDEAAGCYSSLLSAEQQESVSSCFQDELDAAQREGLRQAQSLTHPSPASE